jgi:hypothetical protein
MSFREKSAWITLVTVLICFGAYFGDLVALRLRADGPIHAHTQFHLLFLSVLALVVLQCGLTWIAARLTPPDGRAPADEREREIQWRSHTLGYYVLMALSVGLFAPAEFGHSGLDLANFALLAVVIATLVVAVAQIVMFRRGV